MKTFLATLLTSVLYISSAHADGFSGPTIRLGPGGAAAYNDPRIAGALTSSGNTSNPLTGQLYTNMSMTSSAQQAAIRTIVTAVGAGTLGPSYAQIGHSIGISKANWNSTTITPTAGEIDGQYIVANQGGVGDLSGLLVQATGTGVGTNFINGAELEVYKMLAGTSTPVNGIDVQIGNANDTMYGIADTLQYQEAGATSVAFEAGTQNGTVWTSFLKGLNGGTTQISIDGSGNIVNLGVTSSTLGFYGPSLAAQGSGSDTAITVNTNNTMTFPHTVTYSVGFVTPSATITKLLTVLATPASSSAACQSGQLEADANYVYVCTATNTWKRSALAAF